MASNNKGKKKLVQPTQYKRSTSSMSISSDEETKTVSTEKLMHAAIKAENTYSFSQQPIMEVKGITQHYSALQSLNYSPSQGTKPRMENRNRPQIPYGASSSKPTQNTQITFGNYALSICFDETKKFIPIIGMSLTKEQHCLLDNLWHIQTFPQASTFKVQVLNALSFYFQQFQTQRNPEQNLKKFSHYIIFRGTKVGIFHNWTIVLKHIQCPSPYFKGFPSFQEAMDTAREHFGLTNFYIEPEEVKTFSEIAKTSPEQLIKAQEELIAKLQQQLMQSGKDTQYKDTQYVQTQIENNILKQQIKILEAKNIQLTNKLEKKETVFINRNYDCFKARMLDLPWRQTLKPVLDQFKEYEHMVSQKICTEFPSILYKLQQQIIRIAFQEISHKGVTVVQRLNEDAEEIAILLLQINLGVTDMPEDQIINFYHNGMIDYLEFKLNSKTEGLLNKLGEKFVLTAGNIASHSISPIIGCKIFSSFPAANDHTYRPARKRIFISQRLEQQKYLQSLACQREINFAILTNTTTDHIANAQKTPVLPENFRWENYKLLAEGHYIQIWSHQNWHMMLPFSGDSDTIFSLDDIINSEEQLDTDPDSPVSIDSTHRDF